MLSGRIETNNNLKMPVACGFDTLLTIVRSYSTTPISNCQVAREKIDIGYRLDVLVDDLIIIENKTVDILMPIHEA